jgi:phenylpyruvate tautomerase PptA (4-oxalocrotonate tautomerase family)
MPARRELKAAPAQIRRSSGIRHRERLGGLQERRNRELIPGLGARVLTNLGALDRAKQLAVVEQFTEIVADAAGRPELQERTWVLLTEAPDGGWGLWDTPIPTPSSSRRRVPRPRSWPAAPRDELDASDALHRTPPERASPHGYAASTPTSPANGSSPPNSSTGHTLIDTPRCAATPAMNPPRPGSQISRRVAGFSVRCCSVVRGINRPSVVRPTAGEAGGCSLVLVQLSASSGLGLVGHAATLR